MRIRAFIAGTTVLAAVGLSVALPSTLAPADAATAWPGHPDRALVGYTVRSGDTLTGLAIRFHAWTAELASLNHLRTTSMLRAGQRLRIPVVLSAKRKAEAANRASAARAKAARIAHAVAAVKARYTFRSARSWPGHPDRALLSHIVVRGETPYKLAVRYHAWTRELLAMNAASAFRPGRHVTIPIVVSALHKAEVAAIVKARKAASVTPRPIAKKPLTAAQMRAAGWRDWTMSRTQVRSLIISTAKRHHVSPTLALAIGWQESGWHQPVISRTGAIGVMQLMPGTAHWMGTLAGHHLNPRSTQDNILGGILFLRYLTAKAGPGHTDQVIAGYYQGLTAIGKKPRWFEDTKRYVRSVTAIRRGLS